jgi:hypothetical protein
MVGAVFDKREDMRRFGDTRERRNLQGEEVYLCEVGARWVRGRRCLVAWGRRMVKNCVIFFFLDLVREELGNTKEREL